MAWHQVFTSEDKELIKSFDNLQKQTAKLTAELAKMKAQAADAAKETTKANKDQSEGMGQTIGLIGKMTAGYISVSAALRLVNAEIQNKIDLEKKSATATLSMASAQEDFLVNVGAVSQAEQKAAMARIERIARERGVSRAVAYGIGSEVVSARGAVSTEGAFQAEDLALRLYANNQESARAVAGGVLDVANMTGLTKDADQMKNLGFLQSVGTVARVPSMAMIAENLVPGMKGVVGTGGNAQEAGALAAAMSTAMGDSTGRRSKTAVIQLAAQLKDFLPERDLYKWEKGKKKLEKKGTGLKSPMERIEFLQEHPELAEQFSSGLTGEVEALEPMRQMIRKGTNAAAVLSEARQKVLSPDQGGKLGEEYLARVGGLGVQPQAALDRGLKEQIERLQIQEPAQSVEGITRDHVEELLQASGEGATQGWFGRRARDMGYITDRGRLMHRIHQLRNPGQGDESGTGEGPGEQSQQTIGVLEEAVKQIDETNRLQSIQTVPLQEPAQAAVGIAQEQAQGILPGGNPAQRRPAQNQGSDSGAAAAAGERDQKIISVLEEQAKKADETNRLLGRIESKKPPVDPARHAE